MKVRKWMRLVVSGIIALLLIAVTYPSITRMNEAPPLVPLVIILCMSFIPFLLVCIFADRSKIGEGIGWGDTVCHARIDVYDVRLMMSKVSGDELSE